MEREVFNMENNIENLARQIKNAYHRQWQNLNKEKVRQAQERYWKKKAKEQIKLEERSELCN